ncbi:MAG TPA: SDR family NAD(P)-dependent oxidoreductase [Solirubrobacteraceae bacterium]|nr:SDR family NAD(P)-dependent oxidoreductase [Solirubrobacteraceae bacterium]
MRGGHIDLTGRVALVTGGRRGIGLGVARSLVDAGASVAVAARTPADLDVIVGLSHAGTKVTSHRCDVSDETQVKALVQGVSSRHGRLDILVCSHGVYPGVRRLIDIPGAGFDETIGTNLRGTFLCAREAIRQMIDQGEGGRVIFVSSMNALQSQLGAADYDAAKAGVHGLMRALAVEAAPDGITVNAIAPGWIRTEMSAPELEHLSGRVLNPSRRVGTPDDIGRAALWLADPDNGYVTGSVVVVDGGQTAMLPTPWVDGAEVVTT